MIPERSLELTIDVNKLTLDEAVLFEEGGFTFMAFRQFLLDRSNWTRKEIGKLEVGEMEAIAEQVRREFEKANGKHD